MLATACVPAARYKLVAEGEGGPPTPRAARALLSSSNWRAVVLSRCDWRQWFASVNLALKVRDAESEAQQVAIPQQVRDAESAAKTQKA